MAPAVAASILHSFRGAVHSSFPTARAPQMKQTSLLGTEGKGKFSEPYRAESPWLAAPAGHVLTMLSTTGKEPTTRYSEMLSIILGAE